MLSAAGFYFSGAIIDRLGALRALVGRFLGDRVLMLLAYGLPGPWSAVLLTITALTYGPAQVAQGTLTQREFNPQQRATMGSLDALAGSLGLVLRFAIACRVEAGPHPLPLGEGRRRSGGERSAQARRTRHVFAKRST